ncbi:hypothetical protein F5B21DRAFT_500150 [Xylaria acuta]|nr:hypothetical protein F5B21DRAFT_500150 [Xylaria acuta]
MMYNSKALLSAALLTGSSLAQSSSSSSGGSGDAQCTGSYISLLAGAPTPDGQLASALTSYATGTGANANPLAFATQVCDFSSGLPSSLRSDFDAYATRVISYVSASSADIDAVITNCLATGAEGPSYTSLVDSFAAHTGPLCEATGVPNGTVVTTGTPTPTSTGADGGGGGSGGGAATTSAPTGAAAAVALPTAVLGGAAAAAGLLGAIVLL